MVSLVAFLSCVIICSITIVVIDIAAADVKIRDIMKDDGNEV